MIIALGELQNYGPDKTKYMNMNTNTNTNKCFL